MKKLQDLKETMGKVTEPKSYQIELRFNDKAQLTRVEAPADMTLAMVNEHVAVAVGFLAKELSKEEK